MITDVKNYLVGIAVGIRFRANFKLEDKFGSIVDEILYSHDSFFNPVLFPEVLSNPVEKKLINQTTGNHFSINASNIILELNIGEDINIADIHEINRRFHDDIVKGILEKFEISQINRIGYIKKYLFNIEQLSDVFVNKTIGNTLEGVNDINLRFSKKFPVMKSMAKQDINDYHNVIYNIIKKADKKEIFFSIDYQNYFSPPLNTAIQLKYMEFINDMEKYNALNYTQWLNAYCSETDAQEK